MKRISVILDNKRKDSKRKAIDARYYNAGLKTTCDIIFSYIFYTYFLIFYIFYFFWAHKKDFGDIISMCKEGVRYRLADSWG